MKIVFRSTLAAALMAVLLSCSTTPSTRIKENPAVYQALPAEQQQLVQEGRVSTGMSPQAVFLAWGYPNTTPVQGEKNGKHFMKWVYQVSSPTYTPIVWGGPYWQYNGWYDPNGPMNIVQYVQREVASVTFENHKVTSWQSH